MDAGKRIAVVAALGGGVLASGLLAGGLLAGCRARPSGPVWNLPPLVGQPIDSVKSQLGAGQEGESLSADAQQTTWTKEGTTLSATWRPTNRRVTSWTLVARDQDHAVREEERKELLQVAQLQENDPRYGLDWIEAPDRPLFYTGVRLTPALKTHSVTLRVTGAPSLVQFSYDIAGTQPQKNETITAPPYEEKFNLPDDSQITLTAVLYKAMGSGSELTVQIISDGKVVGSATSASGSVRCKAEL